jgi:enoyl-CoA hydratase/carnithine racemase
MSWQIDSETHHGGRTALLRFADPPRDNQLCWGAVDDLGERLRSLRTGGATVLVLASALPGRWLGHAWLEDLIAGREKRPQSGSGSGWFTALQELTHADWITIAAINGDTAGGGAELGWACDLRVAETTARFCQPEVDLGLTTGIGGSSRLARLAGRGLAAQMVLTGEAQTAERLHVLGAVNFLAPAGEAETRALDLAASLSAKSSAALSGLKRILHQAEQLPLEDALREEQAIFQNVAARDDALQAMKAAQARHHGNAH